MADPSFTAPPMLERVLCPMLVPLTPVTTAPRGWGTTGMCASVTARPRLFLERRSARRRGYGEGHASRKGDWGTR
jgi:hypothetical protein